MSEVGNTYEGSFECVSSETQSLQQMQGNRGECQVQQELFSLCQSPRHSCVKKGREKTRTEVNLFSFLKLHTFDQTEKYGEERSTEEKREFQMFQNLAQKQFLLYKLIESTDVIVGSIYYVRCAHMLHLDGSMVMVCFVQPTAPWCVFHMM